MGTRIPKWTFGERLAKAREDAGITQDEMALKLGVGHATVAKWERNRSQPRDLFGVVDLWSEITGVSKLWLLGGDGGAGQANRMKDWPELPFNNAA